MPSPTQVAREVFEQAAHPGSLRCPEMARIQSILKAWERSQFGEQPVINATLGVSEETGELGAALENYRKLTIAVGKLSHAALKHEQGIRGMDDETKFADAVGDALADIAIYSMQIASSLRLDFFTLLANTASDVTKRSWKTNPTDGSTK